MELKLKKQYYFISGLPRSGSTLLSSILKQNPRFHASISDNLLSHFRSQIECGNAVPPNEFNEDKLKRILNATFNAYYEDINKEVIFNTNRLWTNLLPELNSLFPYTKVICCVRDINRIIDSFERMHQSNPFNISTVYPKDVDMNVYSRSASLMSDGGIVKLPYDSLKSAFTGQFSGMLLLVEYDILTKNPEGTMKTIYNFIGQPYFQHDFENVENSYDEYDKNIKLKGLHTTKKRVEYKERSFILPPDVLNQFSDLEVWR
jgi:sulfotransferase